jgi:hypothetical protein
LLVEKYLVERKESEKETKMEQPVRKKEKGSDPQ